VGNHTSIAELRHAAEPGALLFIGLADIPSKADLTVVDPDVESTIRI